MTPAELRAMCKSAGVLDSEMHDHPALGLCLSPSGIRKLATIAPNKQAADYLRELSLHVEKPKGGVH